MILRVQLISDDGKTVIQIDRPAHQPFLCYEPLDTPGGVLWDEHGRKLYGFHMSFDPQVRDRDADEPLLIPAGE